MERRKSSPSLFNNISIFRNKRICITGEMSMDKKRVKQKLLDLGAKKVDYNTYTKYTHYLILGDLPNEETMKRRTLYEHDGFHAKVLTENDLNNIFAGQEQGFETEDVVTKRLRLTKEHYYWKPPVVGESRRDKECYKDRYGEGLIRIAKTKEGEGAETIRTSSPFDYTSAINPIVNLEIFVPDMKGKDSDLLRQIIGNLGAYANREIFPETQLIILSDESYHALMHGHPDVTLQLIEQTYNNGDSNIFNIPFTHESDFLTWLADSPWYKECAWLMEKYKQSNLKQFMKKNPTFVAIDMEKLNSSQTSVCEIGMVKYVDGKAVEYYTKKVHPFGELKMDPDNKRKLSHIKLEELKTAPTFSDLYNEICTFIGDNLLVCHNVGADMNYLYYMEKEIGKEGLCQHHHADTMEMCKHLLEGKNGLKDCFDYLFGTIGGETMVETHCAINDATVCAKIFNELWQKFDCNKFIHSEPYIPVKERPKKNIQTACVPIDGMEIEDHLIPDFDFNGKIAVVSGTQDENEKNQIITKLEQLGVKVTTSISGKTNILVVGSQGVGPKKKEIALVQKGIRPETFHTFTANIILDL